MSSKIVKKTDKKKYAKMDPIEHMLNRPSMYIDSVIHIKSDQYLPQSDNFLFVKKSISFPPAILRIFIEPLSNAIDNVSRSRKGNIPCTTIKINVRESGETTIWNDGMWIPINNTDNDEGIFNGSLIFGSLLTSSNYNDEEERYDISGTNGLGVKSLALGTKIPLWNGQIKNCEDIDIGDILIGDDGNKRMVSDVFFGENEMWEINQSHGDTYTVSAGHMITLHMPDHRVIFWNKTRGGWSVIWWDKEERVMQTMCFRAQEYKKWKCPECNEELVSSFNRHWERKHNDIPIPKRTRSSPTVESPDTIEVRNARLEAEKFIEKIPVSSTFDITVEDYLKLNITTHSRLQGVKGKCVNWSSVEVKIDPYILGMWLGDGLSTGYGFASEDIELINEWVIWAKKNNAEIVHRSRDSWSIRSKYSKNNTRMKVNDTLNSNEKCSACKHKLSFACSSNEELYNANITRIIELEEKYTNDKETARNPFKALLDNYDLVDNKHIPIEYITNDRNTRLKLLAGFIDTDGTVSREGTRISITQGMNHEKMADQLVLLIRSLGFACSYTTKKTKWTYQGKINRGLAKNIEISGEGVQDIPTKLFRKKCNPPKDRSTGSSTGCISVKRLQKGQWVGITVDDNKRFCIQDFTVTHNCTNVFSKEFKVTGLDPKEKKTFEQIWSNNMKNTSDPVIKDEKKVVKNKGYTEVSWIPDFPRFNLTGYSKDIIDLYRRYAVDTAMLTGVDVYFNDVLIPVKNLKEYAKLYSTSKNEEDSENDMLCISEIGYQVVLMPSNSYEAIAFVNGIYNSNGGTHVDSFSEALFRPVVKKLTSNGVTFTIADVKKFFSLFVSVKVDKPQFESQSKHCLRSPYTAEVKQKDINKILKWQVIEEIKKSKEMVVLKKLERKKRGFEKIEGLDPANNEGDTNCTLILVEGLSAKTYASQGIQVGAFDTKGRDWFGIYALSGKVLNSRNAKVKTIAENKVVSAVIKALGVKINTDYTTEEAYKTLRYGKLMIITDADCFTNDTPLIVKKNNKIDIISIENFERKYNSTDTYEIWSKEGWTKVLGVQKKASSKRIIEINSYCGIIKCTEDHKLMLENGDEVYAKDVKLGDKLLRTRRIEKKHVDINTTNKELSTKCREHQVYKKHLYTTIETMTKAIQFENSFCSPVSDVEEDITISKDEAYVWGLFFADGTCGIYTFESNRKKHTDYNTEKSRQRWQKKIETYTTRLEEDKSLSTRQRTETKQRLANAIEKSTRVSVEKTPSLMRTSYSYSISNCDLDLLIKSKKIMETLYSDYNWTIVECTVLDRYQRSYRLILNGGKKVESFVKSMRERFYDEIMRENKKVPQEIINAPKNIKRSFFEGYYAGDGFRSLKENKNAMGFDILGQIGAQGLCYITEQIGYSSSIKYFQPTAENGFRSRKYNKGVTGDIYTVHVSDRYRRMYPGEVRNIREIDYKHDYVYDIETENHTLNAGIGGMVVHNCDGLHIAGLIMNLIHSLFPTLTQRKDSFLVSMQTPIVKVFLSKTKELLFYDEREYKKYVIEFNKTNPGKNIDKKYYKGLGTSNESDVMNTFGKKLVEFKDDEHTLSNMNKVFNVKQADDRKKWISEYNPNKITLNWMGEKEEIKDITYSEYLNEEMIKFSILDCARSLPHIIDGFKQAARKTLYACKLKKLKYKGKSLKVAQLAGYIAEKTAYHHGEQNLYGTIVNMATEFPGSNNIPLLDRDGQFGTRQHGADDAASPRYIYTKMDALTHLLFREEDDILLDKFVDDGDEVEPIFYVPILPLILINGALGIATGWSSTIPSYNPLDIIACVEVWLDNDGEVLVQDESTESKEIISMFPDIKPWYRGYTGLIEKTGSHKYTSWGNIIDGEKGRGKHATKIVNELPVGYWTEKFKDYAEKLLEEKKISGLKNYSKPQTVLFEIKESDEMECTLESLKLYKYISTSNMVVFTAEGNIKKFDSVDEIINEFCKVRYDYYIRRKKHMLGQLEKEIKFLGNKKRFLTEVMNNDIKLFEEVKGGKRKSRKMSDLVAELETRGYDKEGITAENEDEDDDEETEIKSGKDEEGEDDNNKKEKGYDYLLRLQFRSITEEKINKLLNEINSKIKERDQLSGTSEKKLWQNDIAEFKAAYLIWKVEIEKEKKPKKSAKKSAK